MPAGDPPSAPAPSAADDLERALGAAAPESVVGLPEDVLRRLVERIEAGRAEHERAGVDAIQRALRGVPLPFRALVKKALG